MLLATRKSMSQPPAAAAAPDDTWRDDDTWSECTGSTAFSYQPPEQHASKLRPPAMPADAGARPRLLAPTLRLFPAHW